MTLEINLLDLGDIELESSYLVLGRGCGTVKRIPVYGYLILGGDAPVVVDTGYRDNAIMETLGMHGFQEQDNLIENQLAKYGVKPSDVRYVCHTHLHIDHAGATDKFPMNTTAVVNRKEMELSVSGIMHPQYTKPDVQHFVDRLHTPSALQFEDLELTGEVELIPGVTMESANAHTEGSMNIHVETVEGRATICGDVIYDLTDQVISPHQQIHHNEPQVTGNHSNSKRSEKAAIKKLLSNSRFLLMGHDKPAKIENRTVIARLDMQVPAPVVESLPPRRWLPAS